MLNEILSYWYKSFYLHPMVMICCIYVYNLLRKDSTPTAKYFKIYIVSLFTLFISGDILYSVISLDKYIAHKIIEILNNFFTAIETAVLFYFFGTSIKSAVIKRFIKIILSMVIMAAITINLFVPQNESLHSAHIIGLYFEVIHFYFLIILCLYFFYEVYRSNGVLEFKSTLITFAILSYSLLSIPFLVLFEPLNSVFKIVFQSLTALHYILLISLCFSFVAKSRVQPENSSTLRLSYASKK